MQLPQEDRAATSMPPAARAGARGLQRPARRTARSATTRASSPRCRRSATCSQKRRARDPDVAPRSSQGRARSASTRLKPGARRGSSGCCGSPVAFAPDCVGPEAESAARDARRRRGAAAREPALPRRGGGQRSRVRRAARALGEAYVNDAFGTAHRAHASTEGVAAPAAARGGGLPDAAGARLPGPRARAAGAPVRRDARRRQDLGQDRRHHGTARARSTAC